MGSSQVRWTVVSAAVAGTLVPTDAKEPVEKLSIYPPSSNGVLLADDPIPLEAEIGQARRAVTRTFRGAIARVQGVVDRWIQVEYAIENRVKHTLAPAEPLMPAVLYIGIAGLTGSILARSSSLLVRVSLPPTFVVLASRHFFPSTSSNIAAYCGELEERFAPGLAHKHDVAKAHTMMMVERVRDAWNSADVRIRGRVESAVSRVQSSTGLKLRDALGWDSARPADAAASPSHTLTAQAKALWNKSSKKADASVDNRPDSPKL
ncbi:hypothetical protein FISHEDRAFT_78195 [Fistulina hepatica ATCC 64428]|nr:hypothetical protein FISHEDRAFT_78195 [Fistulina hepatica ATCC 64428]